MLTRGLRGALLASSGVVMVAGAPALAQEEGCTQRLDQIEKQLAEAPMDSQRRQDVREVIKGARTLAATGDQDGCMRVVAELHGLSKLAQEGTQAGQPGQGQQAQQGQERAQQAAGADQEAQVQPDEQGKRGQQVRVETRQGQGDATAEIHVQQPQPRVTINQPQPAITVHVPPPQVTIRMAQPEVVVRMPQPQVDIQIAEPEVQVNTPRPEVRVTMSEPEVQIEPVRPQVQVQEAQPQVVFQESQQQADVRLEMAEPEVHFERATGQAKVTVEQQEPQINVQRAGSPQGQQQLAQVGQQLPGGEQQQLARAGQQLPGGEQQALQQIDQAVRQARHSLERDDAEGAREALDQAGSTIQQAIEHASAEPRQQLQRVEQRVAEAQQALGENDLEGARKALEHTQEPLRQMTEAAGGRAQQTQAAGQQQIQREAEQQDAQAKPEEQVTTPKQLPARTQNPLAAMPASEVIGAEVNNLEGDNVAKVADLVKQQGRDEIYAVLSVGGLLGIGDKKVVVPLDELQVGQEGTIVMANASEERLKQMVEYDEKRYESMAGLGEPPQQR